MTQEEKQLLLKDLCGRLPYGVKVQFSLPNYNTNCFDDEIGEVFEIGGLFTHVHCKGIDYLPNTNRIKPYLRPMSSMTDDEEKEYNKTRAKIAVQWDDYDTPIGYEYIYTIKTFDWLNAHHFDYRVLIEKGLALKAPEEMYKID